MFKTILSFFQHLWHTWHYSSYSVYWATFDTFDMINITLYWDPCMHFDNLSYCGPYNMRNVLGKFRTVWKCKRPDLWTIDLGISVNLLQVLGLQRGPLDISHEEWIMNSKWIRRTSCWIATSTSWRCSYRRWNCSWIWVMQNKSQQIRQVLLGSHSHILEEFLISLLCGNNNEKWNSVELDH